MAEALRLTIALVPQAAWGANLRAALPRAAWEAIRAATYARAGHRCAICGARGRLACHETWRFDDQTRVQRLAGCVALCARCHHVKHLGRAELLARQGKLNLERVIRHFLRVDQCDRAAFEAHRAAAFRQWAERSRHPWTLDLGAYADAAGGTPAARRPTHVSGAPE
jgi:hypothetical protein